MVKLRPVTPELTQDYFPERDAMASHLRQLNNLVSAQKRDSELRKKLALTTTSNDSYGGFYHTPRKEKEHKEYFNPWYRSSLEYGKYQGPLPKKEPPTELEMIMKKKQAQVDKRQKEEDAKRIPPVPEFAHPIKIPPINTDFHGKPTSGAMSDRTAEVSQAKRKAWQQNAGDPNLGGRHLKKVTKDYMTGAMGRMWENMNDIKITKKHGGSLASLHLPEPEPRRPVASRLVKGLERRSLNSAYSHSIPSSRASDSP